MTSRLERNEAAVLVVDLQEKLLPAMSDGASCLAAAAKLVSGAQVLEVPILATEQYPEGLGPTCGEIVGLLGASTARVPKLVFTACVPVIMAEIQAAKRRQVIVCGVETHVCVQQTVLDLLRKQMAVWVCGDAVSSRRPMDRDIALERMRQAGAVVTTVESVLFEMLGAAGTDLFKRMLKVVK